MKCVIFCSHSATSHDVCQVMNSGSQFRQSRSTYPEPSPELDTLTLLLYLSHFLSVTRQVKPFCFTSTHRKHPWHVSPLVLSFSGLHVALTFKLLRNFKLFHKKSLSKHSKHSKHSKPGCWSPCATQSKTFKMHFPPRQWIHGVLVGPRRALMKQGRK